MDKITKAVHRLWGDLDGEGRLHATPTFSAQLAERCNGNLDVHAASVSKWNVGRQLEHLYLTSHYILDRVEESMTGKNSSGRMGIYGYGLMFGGFIPRGVFPTIPPLVPASGTMEHIQPLRERLAARLSQIEWDLDQIRASPGKSLHPRMKYLTSIQWLYFAEIHHRHHLAIMRDILNAAGRSPR